MEGKHRAFNNLSGDRILRSDKDPTDIGCGFYVTGEKVGKTWNAGAGFMKNNKTIIKPIRSDVMKKDRLKMAAFVFFITVIAYRT